MKSPWSIRPECEAQARNQNKIQKIFLRRFPLSRFLEKSKRVNKKNEKFLKKFVVRRPTVPKMQPLRCPTSSSSLILLNLVSAATAFTRGVTTRRYVYSSELRDIRATTPTYPHIYKLTHTT